MVHGPDRSHGDAVKCFKALSLVFILLAGCASVPADGEAVECDVCRALWIRLYPANGPEGVYRLNHDRSRELCAGCESSAVRSFQTGEIPVSCRQCGGRLTARPVNIAR